MLSHQPAAGILMIFGFIHREQLKLALAFDLRICPGNQIERNTVEIERDLVPCYSFPGRYWIRPHQGSVAFEPGKISLAHQHAAELGLVLKEIQQAEFG